MKWVELKGAEPPSAWHYLAVPAGILLGVLLMPHVEEALGFESPLIGILMGGFLCLFLGGALFMLAVLFTGEKFPKLQLFSTGESFAPGESIPFRLVFPPSEHRVEAKLMLSVTKRKEHAKIDKHDPGYRDITHQQKLDSTVREGEKESWEFQLEVPPNSKKSGDKVRYRVKIEIDGKEAKSFPLTIG